MVQDEDSRLKEFRQLKSEIKESRDYLVVGIDVAKERHYAFFGTAAGKTRMRGSKSSCSMPLCSRRAMHSGRWYSALSPRETTTSRWVNTSLPTVIW